MKAMRHTATRITTIIVGLLLAACGGAPGTTTPAPASAPTSAVVAPAANAIVPTLIAPVAATRVAPAEPRAVTFTTNDGVTLKGTLYGAGPTAVILSNMGDNDPGPWEAFAPQLANRGYTVLTYRFRYPTNTANIDSSTVNHTLDDLRAAIAFMREQGATTLVLAGASLGGMATAKAAASEKLAAIVIMASPVDLPDFGFRVEERELQAITAPKLFIGSEDDRNVPLAETKRMYDLSPDPKTLHTYPGSAHGVRLFKTEHSADLTQQLLAFITTHAPVGN
jgi:dipeptidyl aminopeptidase/acylaminoacyl peptidase